MGILRSKLTELAQADGASGEAPAESQTRTAPATSADDTPTLSSLAKSKRKKKGRLRPPQSRGNHVEPQAPKPVQENAAVPNVTALGQVRDLLVGSELGDFGSRIEALEANSNKQAKLIGQMLESIEALQKSATALATRCDNESRARAALEDTLEQRITTLEVDLSATEERLRSEVVVQGTVMSGLVQQRHEEAVESLRVGLARLDAEKAGRSALAEVLLAAASTLDNSENSDGS